MIRSNTPRLREDRQLASIPASVILIVASTLLLFLLPNVALTATIALLAVALGLITLFVGIIFDGAIAMSRLRLAMVGSLILVSVILGFAGVYYTQSQTTARAFSKRLSRSDALYLAIGTMSTAGTNGVEARLGSAKAELATQQLVDVSAIALLIGGVIGRLGAREGREHEVSAIPS